MTQILGERLVFSSTTEEPAVEGTVVIPPIGRDPQFSTIFGENSDACGRYTKLRNLEQEADNSFHTTAVIDARPGEFAFGEPHVPPLSVDDRLNMAMPNTFPLLITEQPRIASPPPQEQWGFSACTRRLMAHIGSLTADKCVEHDAPEPPAADIYTSMEAEVDFLLAQVIETKKHLLARDPELPIFTLTRAKGTSSWFN